MADHSQVNTQDDIPPADGSNEIQAATSLQNVQLDTEGDKGNEVADDLKIVQTDANPQGEEPKTKLDKRKKATDESNEIQTDQSLQDGKPNSKQDKEQIADNKGSKEGAARDAVVPSDSKEDEILIGISGDNLNNSTQDEPGQTGKKKKSKKRKSAKQKKKEKEKEKKEKKEEEKREKAMSQDTFPKKNKKKKKTENESEDNQDEKSKSQTMDQKNEESSEKSKQYPGLQKEGVNRMVANLGAGLGNGPPNTARKGKEGKEKQQANTKDTDTEPALSKEQLHAFVNDGFGQESTSTNKTIKSDSDQKQTQCKGQQNDKKENKQDITKAEVDSKGSESLPGNSPKGVVPTNQHSDMLDGANHVISQTSVPGSQTSEQIGQVSINKDWDNELQESGDKVANEPMEVDDSSTHGSQTYADRVGRNENANVDAHTQSGNVDGQSNSMWKNATEAISGTLSGAVSGAKALFGFPPQQKKSYYYVSTQQPVAQVILCVYNKVLNVDTSYHNMEPIDPARVHWRIEAFPVKYPFVIYHYVQWNGSPGANDFRERYEHGRDLNGKRSQYTVFRHPSLPNNYIYELYWFVNYVYLRMCSGELNLESAIQEYDQIGYGNSNFARQERVNYANKIQKELTQFGASGTKEVLFLAHAIQNFDERLRHKDKKSWPLLKDLIENETAIHVLLDVLFRCDKTGMDLVHNAPNLIASLICKVQRGRSLEMLIKYLINDGPDVVFSSLSNLQFRWCEEDVAYLRSEHLALFSDLKHEKLRNRMLGFILKRTSSLAALLQLQDFLKEVCPEYLKSYENGIKKQLNDFLTGKKAGSEVLRKTSWSALPQSYKHDLVEPFLTAMKAQTVSLIQIESEQEEAIKAFFTDETVLKNDLAKKEFLDIFKNPTLSKVLIEILQDPHFRNVCWNEAEGDFKETVYHRVVSFTSRISQQGKHFVTAFHDLNSVFVSLDVCPLDGIKEAAVKKCHDKVSAEDLSTVADAYGFAESLHAGVREEYFLCLQNAIEREVKGDRTRESIVELLGKLPKNDNTQKDKIERITKITLQCLCKDLKVPTEAREMDERGFNKVFEDVAKNANLWYALLDVWPQEQTLHEFPQVTLLINAIGLFIQALEEGTIRIGDLRNFENRIKGVIVVLQKMLVVFCNSSETGQISLSKLVASCLQKENKVSQNLQWLIKTVRFVREVTADIIEVEGVDTLEELIEQKGSFEEFKVCEVLKDDFVLNAGLFTFYCDDLNDLMKFKVFQNAVLKGLSCYKTNFIKSKSLGLPTLIALGKSRLKKLCLPLFEIVGSMQIEDADVLLDGVSENTLKGELDFIQRVCNDVLVLDAWDTILRFVRYPEVREKMQALSKLLGAVNLSFVTSVSNFFKKEKTDYEDLAELYEATETVIGFADCVHGSKGEVIKELADSKELIQLLEETAGDDVRNLIDAVEEHSDTTVAAKEVSDFIEIHKVFAPVFQASHEDFFIVLEERLSPLSDAEVNAIAARIKASGNHAHSLRNVYKNVANRGEMTKEIVAAALQRGTFKISNAAPKQRWEYSVTYDESDDSQSVHQQSTHSMEKLQDIKSRALLIVNSEKNQSSDESDVSFEDFIDKIDLLNDIVIAGEELQQAGHRDYEDFWRSCSSVEDIQATFDELSEGRQMWNDMVKKVRSSHFYLNFFHPKQLWTLKEFINGNKTSREEALSLLRFVDPSVTAEQLGKFDGCQAINDGKDYLDQFSQIGLSLERFFKGGPYRPQDVTQVDTKQGLSVAVLDKGSSQTPHVIMKLFQEMPLQANKVLFCHENSTWDEIELFLRRCFTPNNNSVPHCLANVESLDIDMQFQLVDAIRRKQASRIQYWLVLICRGGEHDHIIHQFQDNVKRLPAMTDRELKMDFSSKFKDVSLVISDLPGLGKTEKIWQLASQKRKKLVCFPINGPFDRHKLVHRLSELDLDEHCFLHIDVSEVDDPSLVDTFLFELIVLGMVSSSTTVFHLPTYCVAIEVANTLQHHLRDSLAVTKCFRRTHQKWDDFKDFVCSQEKESAVQVVCQYLSAHEKNALEKEALTSKDLKKAQPLSEGECRRLLMKYTPWKDLSFNTVEIFLNVLAVQLRRFSLSPFFRPENLTAAVKETGEIRKHLFEALKDVSIEFARRSVEACRETQYLAQNRRSIFDTNTSDTATEMVNRVKGMVKWAEDNHLVVMFQQGYSISALFRELEKVPKQVQELFKSQNAPLPNLDNLSEQDLEKKLRQILNVDSKNQDVQTEGYVLTPDNVLKMVLIVQRIRARVPVIVMGETGCGKTSLVRYLAKCCDVKFSVMNFHAGIYEEAIVRFTEEQIKEAEKDMDKEVWVFFDEINTCDYLGLINDIICHRSLNGRELPPNIVFIAACNPYCLRSTNSIATAGLSGKSLTDEYSNLVYRVKPLPETMMDYVWDYGSLDHQDEKAYIRRMVDSLNVTLNKALVVDLLATSQKFIRDLQSRYSVSLRDVRRCILLAEWFMKVIRNRPKLEETKLPQSVREAYKGVQRHSVEDRSIILALAHSYQSRIPKSEQREDFRKELGNVYRQHGNREISAEVFHNVVRAEQEEILARMELPDGTARNTALRENVFVILVCILNRIPVFVVGKPGCSKSLSMQVIISNLRGKDSKDAFFKTLPQLLVVSYQGSESSTSEGILKVFEKAQKYREQNKEDESLPVVLLDEVGLAEISKYNPLKVLHRLLEPEEKERPDVSVVGISNWALDAAKMNRAIHLSRPEPTLDDLEETGESILEAQFDESSRSSRSLDEHALQALDDEMLKCLVKSYFEYQSKQIHANFHGLRDYYSLIKCLSQLLIQNDSESSSLLAESTFRSLQRNFGGLPNEDNEIAEIFTKNAKQIKCHDELDYWMEFPTSNLIADNLQDKGARHLMLITSGQSSFGIIDDSLGNVQKEKVVIYGSKFEEDQSEDYSYRTLSRIILYMERECVLILKDLENVYGSLYDMLNQNYVVVGQKKNCRVALGPYSNPMCQVNDGFRCIVLVDEKKVDYTDPPFLNRFEKQLLRYSDVLKRKEMRVIQKLETWVKDFSTVEGQDFQVRDVFLGLEKDTLASVVLMSRQTSDTGKPLFEKCKEKMLDIATPDGVLRSLRSEQFKKDPPEIKAFYDMYFKEKPLHNGLKGYIKHFHKDRTSALTGSSFKYFVMTHSSIHTDVAKCLEGSLSCQVEKLGTFKSERQLTKAVQQFFQDSREDDLLVFQCKPELDAEHMLLMRSTLEQGYDHYLNRCKNELERPTKSICIIVHLQRDKTANPSEHWQFSFLNHWKQATIDALEEPDVPIYKVLGKSVVSLMEDGVLSLNKIMTNELMWCFTRLKYPQSSDATRETIDEQLDYLKSTTTMMKYLENIVLRWITKHHGIQDDRCLVSNLSACEWQVQIACDKNALLTSCTLSSALLRHIDVLVRRPLAKAIFLIEDRLSFQCCQRALKKAKDKSYHHIFLADLIMDENLFNIDEIPDPHEAHCYVLAKPGLVRSLNFPFSLVFNGKVDSLRDNVLAKSKDLEKDEHPELFFQEIYEDIQAVIPQLFEKDWLKENLSQYIEDVFDFATAKCTTYSSDLRREERLKIMKAACGEHLRRLPESSFEIVLAQIYFFLWKYEGYYLSILQLYWCCKEVLNKDFDQITNAYVQVFERALYASFYEDNEFLSGYDNIYTDVRDQREQSKRDDEDADEEASSSSDSDDDSDDSSSGSDDEYDDDDEDDSSGSDSDDSHSGDSDSSDVESGADDDDDMKSNGKHNAKGNPNKGDRARNDEVGSAKHLHGHRNDNTHEAIRSEQVEGNTINQVTQEENISFHYEDQKHEVVDVQSPFLETFFNALCESLLPYQQFLAKVGGPKNWQTLVNTFISFFGKSAIDETTSYIYLRICNEFSDMVLKFENFNNPHSLHLLSALYDQGNNRGNLENCFQALLEVLEGFDSHTTDVNKFKVSFLTRCLQKCETEQFFKDIVNAVSLFTDKEASEMASPLVVSVLHYIFWNLDEDEAYDVSYCSILEGKLNGSPSVQVLDEALNQAIANAGGVVDCRIVTVFLDAFDKLMPGADLFDPEELSDSNCETIACLKNAIAVVKEPRQKQSTFMLLTGISYLRSVLSSLTELIDENPSILKKESDYSSFLSYINSLFEVPIDNYTISPRKASCLLYFLKELKKSHSISELQKLCSKARQLPILPILEWNDDVYSRAFDLCPDSPTKCSIRGALDKLVADNDGSLMEKVCTRLPADSKSRKEFAAVLIEDMYLSQSQADTVDNARDTIAGLLPSSLSHPYHRFLLCLLGKEDFGMLRFSSSQQIQHSTVILHLTAILTAAVDQKQNVDRPFFSYFFDPLKAAKGRVLASTDINNTVPSTTVKIFTCKCGTAFVRSDERVCCPQHRKNCSTQPESIEITEKATTKETTLCVADCQDEVTVDKMTPSSFRVLHILVHSALIAGVSLERFSLNTLAQFLSTDSNPFEACWDEIGNDLQVLKRLWNCSEEQVLANMHRLLENLSSLITKPMGYVSLTTMHRSQLQGQVSEEVEQFLQRQTNDLSVPNPDSLEAKIEEQDDTDNFSVEQRNNWIPRLFRSTKKESLDDFSSVFSSTVDAKKNHPLIGLFLKNLNILPYVSHLYPIVKFPKVLERTLGRRLSRNNAQKSMIGDVIKGENYEELKVALDEFCESWKAIRHEIKKEVGKDVPRLSEASRASYFLIDKGSDGEFLQGAILVLQSMQNDFQGHVLHLAMQGSSKALDFLRKSEVSCALPMVHVQDATKEQIIHFVWDDSMLLHSHHNTDYGRGNQIWYDFEKIERELTGRHLLGTVYLDSSEGLKAFPYSSELFHASTNVLNVLMQRLPQEPIDVNMESRLNLIKQKKLESVRVLLEHLEVIICWLVESSTLNPTMAIVDYVKRKLSKSNLLPESIFQDTKHEFQLRHIVSMYQKLEEMFSTLAADNVNDQYRSQLSDSRKAWLEKVTADCEANDIKELAIVITSLRRYIFRYLLSEHDAHLYLDPNENVVEHLNDPSLWPLTLTSYDDGDETTTGYKYLIGRFVPTMMRACEVHPVMAFYDGFIKSKQDKEPSRKATTRKARTKMAPSFLMKSKFA